MAIALTKTALPTWLFAGFVRFARFVIEHGLSTAAAPRLASLQRGPGVIGLTLSGQIILEHAPIFCHWNAASNLSGKSRISFEKNTLLAGDEWKVLSTNVPLGSSQRAKHQLRDSCWQLVEPLLKSGRADARVVAGC